MLAYFPSKWNIIAGWRGSREEPYRLLLLHGKGLHRNFPGIMQPPTTQPTLPFIWENLYKVAIYVEQQATLLRKHWPLALADLIFLLNPKERREAETLQKETSQFSPHDTSILHKSRWNTSHKWLYLPEGQHFPFLPEVHRY